MSTLIENARQAPLLVAASVFMVVFLVGVAGMVAVL